ncbi:Gustatory receptor 185 [Halyomorpha halys]|nr:Gustatory receptor 185 [Halyomorpha halys]
MYSHFSLQHRTAMEHSIGCTTWCWRWFGLFPFIKNGGHYRSSYCHFALVLFGAVGSCLCSFYYYIAEDFSNFPPAQYSNLILGLLLRELLTLYSCFVFCFRSAELKRMMESIEEVEKLIMTDRVGSVKTLRPRWRYVGHLTYVCFSLAYEMIVNSYRWGLITTYYVGRMGWTLRVLQLMDLLNLFSIYFSQLDRMVSHSRTIGQLHCLIDCYEKLCSLMSTFHELFGLSLLLAFSHLFVFVVSYIFMAVGYHFFTSVNQEINIFTFLTLPIFILQLVRPCSKTSESAVDFTASLYHIMQEDATTLISGDNKLRLHIKMQREVTFTAFGFFTINHTLIYSMVHAATTYFIILVQFSRTPSGVLHG